MFLSFLYLVIVAAILFLTLMSIWAIVKDRPVMPWILGLLCVSLIYLLVVAISVWL
jgi:hypothetical protein